MSYILGIDGGGTKTAYLLADESGRIIDQYKGPTIHYMQCGYDGLTSTIKEAVDYFINKQKIHRDEIAYCFVGAAGYGDIEEDKEFIKQAIAKGLEGIPFAVDNDTFNAHAGALLGQDGICVIAGTGSIGLGVNKDQSIICGGWHHAFGGDEGSAHWIAENYIQEFTKQSDLRSPRTLLYTYMKDKYNFNNDSDALQQFIVDWDYDRTKIASLSKDVYELAKKKDSAALAIFKKAAYELSLIYRSIYKQLDYQYKIPVSYIGGVFQSKEFILEPLKEYLHDLNLEFVTPKFSADIGSLLIAYKYLGIAIDNTLVSNLETFHNSL
ncbi:N-acetylglucosamine kinase-like BadF-type ATPase [Breznakia sp. PF5-3]|uniref:N-acetylglucosamine kinase n=1 Tax=unclassified Breznakia TaxID=2623764 RepID=UPI002407192A|nr:MULTISPECIES: BadF/BadG/BcrA/BcrD ATPase family protein [unclassified Breznakia]MDF9824836.1 N-acetylglucosamine kinase-like BadF-type ATPase [Breznakia sp. PM6-1]MDF9835202.1 N-acetylglucosamine kinase-like BadF-type ATPase [Breznakia sp. PF5-3]MDF9837314.1 N-acetylglucosamine kinase-like BadF-type ATPase [Breznakia sp. PFB2-8]MDF9859762.1 N-acetylglucosamine kinase-like BadF-type ATPase [Breznakia sp. PH5-24]